MASQHRRAIGVLPDRITTASAIQALLDANFSMHNISVITRDADDEGAIAGVKVKENVGNKADKGGAVGAVTGGVLGGVAGLLLGLGAVTIPGVAPILLAGEAATAIATTLAGGVAGAAAGGLLGALVGLGVPEKRARQYRDRVNAGDYLLLLKDTNSELKRAEAVLQHYNIQDWGIYDIPQKHHSQHNNQPDNQPDPHQVAAQSDQSAQSVRSRTIDRDSINHEPTAINSSNGSADRTDRTYHQSFSVTEPNPRATLRQDNYYSEDIPAPNFTRVDSQRANQYNMVDHPMDQQHSANQAHAEHEHGGYGATDTSFSSSHQYPETSAAHYYDLESDSSRAIGMFKAGETLDAALNALRDTNFPMHKLSVIARDCDLENCENQAEAGHAIGSTAGFMAGFNRVQIPAIGSVLFMGQETSHFAQVAQSNQVTSLPDALMRLGIPEDEAKLYSRHLDEGAYLVTLRGSEDEAVEAASVLNQHGMKNWGVYDMPAAATR